jgi:hypothetical protein
MLDTSDIENMTIREYVLIPDILINSEKTIIYSEPVGDYVLFCDWYHC